MRSLGRCRFRRNGFVASWRVSRCRMGSHLLVGWQCAQQHRRPGDWQPSVSDLSFGISSLRHWAPEPEWQPEFDPKRTVWTQNVRLGSHTVGCLCSALGLNKPAQGPFLGNTAPGVSESHQYSDGPAVERARAHARGGRSGRQAAAGPARQAAARPTWRARSVQPRPPKQPAPTAQPTASYACVRACRAHRCAHREGGSCGACAWLPGWRGWRAGRRTAA